MERSRDTRIAPRMAFGLGEAQRSILGEVKRRGESTVTELANAPIGGEPLARETVRSHLKTLESQDLVERAGARRTGPGRPEVLYRLTAAGDRLFPQRHGNLLSELAEFLDADRGGNVLEEFFADRTHRKREALLPRVEHLEEAERLHEVAAILSEEGFLAEVSETGSGAARLRLCHCPWRDLVAVSQVPCRSEMTLVSALLGQRLAREMFMPDGDSSCTYSLSGAVRSPRTAPDDQPSSPRD